MSVTLLPRFPIPGYEEYSPEEAAELLHQEKNRPEGPPSAVLRKLRPFHELTPDEQMYPKAMYREWKESERQLALHRAAGRMQMSLSNPLELEALEQFIGKYDSTNAISRKHQDDLKAQGWCDSPNDAKQAAFLAHRELATDAAVSYTDDRKILSQKALAEREVRDDAADDHIADIPADPIPSHRKRGRPRKAEVQ